MKRLLISAALAFSLIGGAAKADDAACQKVHFADVGWTDIQVTTGVAQVLLEALGYEPEVNTLAVPVTYASLKSKDLDVFLGNWMPSMTADVTPYLEDKSVEFDCSEPRQCRLWSRCAPIRGGRRSEEFSRISAPTRTSSAARFTASRRATTATASSAA